MLNLVVFQGRIAHDIVLEHTKSGTQYCRLRVATDRDYVSDGQRKTDFLSCVAWRDRAVFAAKYFAKGSMVTVRGRLEEDTWTDKDGNTRSRMIVNVDGLYFGETKKAREEREQRGADSFTEMPPLPGDEDVPPEWLDDAQLPF